MSSNLFLSLSRKASWVAAKMNSLILEPLTTDEMDNLLEVPGRVIYNKDDNLLHLFTEDDEWIPIGEQGPTGPTGPAGSPGSTGPTGPAGGSSAPQYYMGYPTNAILVESGLGSVLLQLDGISLDTTNDNVTFSTADAAFFISGKYLITINLGLLVNNYGGNIQVGIGDYDTNDKLCYQSYSPPTSGTDGNLRNWVISPSISYIINSSDYYGFYVFIDNNSTNDITLDQGPAINWITLTRLD